MDQSSEKDLEVDYDNLDVNEPHLGPWWALLMLALYLLKRAFPPESGSLWYWIYFYIVALFIIVTGFTIYKRAKFNRWLRGKEGKDQES